MSVSGFIFSEWALILLLTALFIFIKTTVHLDKSVSARMLVIIFLTAALAVIEYIEVGLGNAETYSVWRRILTAAKYSVPPYILIECLLVIQKYRHPYLSYIPAIINTAVCAASVFFKIVFTIDANRNTFQRGILWILPFVVSGAYLVLAFYHMVFNNSRSVSDIVSIGFLVVPTTLSFVLPFIWLEDFDRWFCTTIAICVFVFYVNILLQLTKKDALTGLLNRQCYYSDIERGGSLITAAVSLDMNGLKYANDHYGHAEGDRALVALSLCFARSVKLGQRVYRVGGDEFMILCRRTSEYELSQLIARIRANLEKCEYSCSVGSCYRGEGMTVEELIRRSDERMYAEKNAYYESIGESS